MAPKRGLKRVLQSMLSKGASTSSPQAKRKGKKEASAEEHDAVADGETIPHRVEKARRMGERLGADLYTGNGTLQRHALLQGLLERRFATLEEAGDLCEALTGDSGDFFSIVGSLNSVLLKTELKIKSSQVPRSGDERGAKSYVSLVNLAKDDCATQATRLNYAEITFFKRAVEHILGSEGTCATSIDLMNLECAPASPSPAAAGPSSSDAAPAAQQAALTKKEREGLVKSLTREGWLRSVRSEGKMAVTLGPRTFLELKGPLMEMDLPQHLADQLS